MKLKEESVVSAAKKIDPTPSDGIITEADAKRLNLQNLQNLYQLYLKSIEKPRDFCEQTGGKGNRFEDMRFTVDLSSLGMNNVEEEVYRDAIGTFLSLILSVGKQAGIFGNYCYPYKLALFTDHGKEGIVSIIVVKDVQESLKALGIEPQKISDQIGIDAFSIFTLGGDNVASYVIFMSEDLLRDSTKLYIALAHELAGHVWPNLKWGHMPPDRCEDERVATAFGIDFLEQAKRIFSEKKDPAITQFVAGIERLLETERKTLKEYERSCPNALLPKFHKPL